MRNLHQLFVLCTGSQIIGGNFAKFCGLLRIYDLYLTQTAMSMLLLREFFYVLRTFFFNIVASAQKSCIMAFLQHFFIYLFYLFMHMKTYKKLLFVEFQISMYVLTPSYQVSVGYYCGRDQQTLSLCLCECERIFFRQINAVTLL